MLVPEKRTVFELLESRDPIWVVNNTKSPSYLVALDFGRGIKFPPLPPGPDPVCLTDAIPHKNLSESYDFRQAVAKGLLQIVTDVSARNYFEKNAGRKEAIKQKLERLMKRSNLVTEEESGSVVSRAQDARDILSPKVLQLHAAYKERNIKEKELLEELLEIQNDLQENDLEYLRSLDSPAVKQFVTDVTEERRKAIVEEAKKEESSAKQKKTLTKESSKEVDEDDFPID